MISLRRPDDRTEDIPPASSSTQAKSPLPTSSSSPRARAGFIAADQYPIGDYSLIVLLRATLAQAFPAQPAAGGASN